MKLFGLGPLELVIILVVVLLIFGPKNLPKLGASLGKTVKNIKKGMNDDDDDDAVVVAQDADEADDEPAGDAADDDAEPSQGDEGDDSK